MATSEKFTTRIGRLMRKVGNGDLTASVVVDQVYAKYQHESLDLRHPNGGQAKYLWEPMFNNRNQYMAKLARNVLRGNLTRAMIDNAEDIVVGVIENAPVELADLHQSGAPTVTDNRSVVYQRPPVRPRLTPAELAAKSRLRTILGMNLGFDPRNPGGNR